MYTYAPSLRSIRRWVEGLKRRFARELAMVRVLPVANQIVELWNIAIANQQPKPDPLTCIGKFTDAGIRLQTFKDVHIYLKDCRKYGDFPDAIEIASRLFPAGGKVRQAKSPGATP